MTQKLDPTTAGKLIASAVAAAIRAGATMDDAIDTVIGAVASDPTLAPTFEGVDLRALRAVLHRAASDAAAA